MSVLELMKTRRTYRRFAQRPVPEEVVAQMLEAARYAPSAANLQPLKYLVIRSPELVEQVFARTRWAGYLPPEDGVPKEGERPVLFVVVLEDSQISKSVYVATDAGLAISNMTLAAWDKEVGSCIMGAINKPALTELLGIEEPLKLAYMVAFGYPTHKAHIVPLTADTGVKYYLDENRDYCVPKRSAEEIARSV